MKSRIVSGVIGVSILAFFALAIPLDTYNDSPFILSLLGSLVVATCIAQAFINFGSLYEFMTVLHEGAASESSKRISDFLIIGAFAVVSSCVLLFMIHKEKVKNELKYNGIAGMAEIKDGFHEITKSTRNTSNSYHLTLKFQDIKGKPQTINTYVKGDVYEKVGLHLKLPIIYSANYPTVYKLVTDPSVYMSEYSPKATANGQPDEYQIYLSKLGDNDVLPEPERAFRNINISDLMIFDTLSNANMLEYLNNISENWEDLAVKNTHIWANKGRGEMVSKSGNGLKLSVYYNDSTFTNVAPLKYLQYIEFTETSKDKSNAATSRTYEHPKYILSIEPQMYADKPKAYTLNFTLKRRNGSVAQK
jgi:hypothetical protein